MPSEGFRGVSLKKELVDEVEALLKKRKRWRSITDFVSEAVRLRLEDLKQRGEI